MSKPMGLEMFRVSVLFQKIFRPPSNRVVVVFWNRSSFFSRFIFNVSKHKESYLESIDQGC